MHEEFILCDPWQVQPTELRVLLHGRCLRPTLRDYPDPEIQVYWRIQPAALQPAQTGWLNFVVSTHRRHNLAAVAQAKHLRAAGESVLLILAESGNLTAADLYGLTWMADVNIVATLHGLDAIVHAMVDRRMVMAAADLADLQTFFATPGRIDMAQADADTVEGLGQCLGQCLEQLRVRTLSRFSGVWVAVSLPCMFSATEALLPWQRLMKRLSAIRNIDSATRELSTDIHVFSRVIGDPHITLMLHSAE